MIDTEKMENNNRGTPIWWVESGLLQFVCMVISYDSADFVMMPKIQKYKILVRENTPSA